MSADRLIPVEEALKRVLDGAVSLPTEEIPIAEAHGRVLAKPLASRRTQPPADLSSMDGYAVRAADLAKPATLKLVGASAAGRPFTGSIKPGETARIFTGALLPAGADTVIPQEDAKAEGDRIALPAARLGQYVRKKGLDFAQGQVLLDAGRRISARDRGARRRHGSRKNSSRSEPRVAIIATGDELVPPGSGAAPDRTIASNPLSLAALLRTENAEILDLGIVPDDLDVTVSTIRKAREAGVDILVTLGGASVGEHDLVAKALNAEGVKIDFHRVALRPGRPMLLARAEPRACSACREIRFRLMCARCCSSCHSCASCRAARIFCRSRRPRSSARRCTRTTTGRTICAPKSSAHPTAVSKPRRSIARTAQCWPISPPPKGC